MAHAEQTGTWSGLEAPLSTPWTGEVGPDAVLPEHPRPQLRRPRWQNLNGLWQFRRTDGAFAAPVGEELEERVLVPFPTESVLSGLQAHSDHMVYRREFEVPAEWTASGNRVRLHFGAVNHEAVVLVDGQEIVRHRGGYTSFSADVTDALRTDGPHELIVLVHSPVDGAPIPVGKQRLEPGGIFYTASSGIWQTVWLEAVAPVSIAALEAAPDLDRGAFVVTARLHGEDPAAMLEVEVLDGEQRVAGAEGPAAEPLVVPVPDARLWSPDDPFRYGLRLRLRSASGLDEAESDAGMRSIAVADVVGVPRILLNGKAEFLLSTLDQGYWPDGISTAPTDEALRFDLERTKALGFNTVRKHIKVEPARWYDWADRLGLMVWQDMPSLSEDASQVTDEQEEAFLQDLDAMIEQLRGVTSIIGWVPYNEGWGQRTTESATVAADRVLHRDPTRLVDARSGANCCWTPGDPGNGDVIDWHQYQGPAFPEPDARRAAMDGEHGGMTLPVEGHAWPSAVIDPYGTLSGGSDELTAAYVANTEALRDRGAAGVLSAAVYTQITDVEGEQNGLLTYDRRVLKVDEAAVRGINEETIAAGRRAAG